jgi:hypothetical protein
MLYYVCIHWGALALEKSGKSGENPGKMRSNWISFKNFQAIRTMSYGLFYIYCNNPIKNLFYWILFAWINTLFNRIAAFNSEIQSL